MKTFVPSYYGTFRCIAERCRHNCCVGWEIDVDEESYARYAAVEGDFGARLRAGIDVSGDAPCFRLGAGERCVFLNDRGLCDIITALGEEALCEICALHPRYRHFFADRVEMGLGLYCEEACRLILTAREPVTLTVLEDDGGGEPPCEEEEEFFAVRARMLEIVQDRTRGIAERLVRLEDFCGLHRDSRAPAAWAEIYRALERLDHSWDAVLDRLSALTDFDAEDGRDTVWEQLAVYFLLRYTPDSLDDGALACRVAFCLQAVRLLRALGAGMPTEELIELCRMYSCEVEYSEENVEALLSQVTL
ncbi:MAG: flagellin lysine-N-methylase [Clostridia bacterium]|nr:flagellin lysine-N-methylase [Clostridia bacterium]